MNSNEFIGKYDGKYLEVGGSPAAQYQCVDLANGYIMEVLGKDPILGANADDFPSRALEIFDWYPYQGQYGEAGDLVVFDMGDYGHIALITGIKNGAKFQTFSQNYPLKSNCHLVDFNLANNITGYLRPKKEAEMCQDCDKIRKEYEDKIYHGSRNVVFECRNPLLGRPGHATEAEVEADAQWMIRTNGDKFNLPGFAQRILTYINSAEAIAHQKALIDDAVKTATAGLFTQTQVDSKIEEAKKGLIKPKDCPTTPDPYKDYGFAEFLGLAIKKLFNKKG